MRAQKSLRARRNQRARPRASRRWSERVLRIGCRNTRAATSGSTLAGLDTEIDTARLVASAEMLTEQRENDAALSAINSLQGEGRRHIHAMRIALSANLQSGRWDEALKAVRLLEKEKRAASGFIAQAEVHDLSRAADRAQRRPGSARSGVASGSRRRSASRRRSLSKPRGLFNDAVPGLARWLSSRSRVALHVPPTDWDESARSAARRVWAGEASSARDQLERVEAWLKAGPFRWCPLALRCCTPPG